MTLIPQCRFFKGLVCAHRRQRRSLESRCCCWKHWRKKCACHHRIYRILPIAHASCPHHSGVQHFCFTIIARHTLCGIFTAFSLLLAALEPRCPKPVNAAEFQIVSLNNATPVACRLHVFSRRCGRLAFGSLETGSKPNSGSIYVRGPCSAPLHLFRAAATARRLVAHSCCRVLRESRIKAASLASHAHQLPPSHPLHGQHHRHRYRHHHPYPNITTTTCSFMSEDQPSPHPPY
jgi:hypothetical protein